MTDQPRKLYEVPSLTEVDPAAVTVRQFLDAAPVTLAMIEVLVDVLDAQPHLADMPMELVLQKVWRQP